MKYFLDLEKFNYCEVFGVLNGETGSIFQIIFTKDYFYKRLEALISSRYFEFIGNKQYEVFDVSLLAKNKRLVVYIFNLHKMIYDNKYLVKLLACIVWVDAIIAATRHFQFEDGINVIIDASITTTW